MEESMKAKLRVCCHCEWIYKIVDKYESCPKCSWLSYSDRYVYGKKAYKYAKTQEPWKNRKIEEYIFELNKEIDDGFLQKKSEELEFNF